MDLTVGNKFDEGFNQESCYACHYVEEDNGLVSGNTNCPDRPTQEMIKSCPLYAANGCYTGTAVHVIVRFSKKNCTKFDQKYF